MAVVVRAWKGEHGKGLPQHRDYKATQYLPELVCF